MIDRREHSFTESLERSHAHADAPWWLEVYRIAFPTLAAAVNVRKDGWAQRAGIDRKLVLNDGRSITVDEKVREKDWPDFLLERFSDEKTKSPGWVQKSLDCDFIAYAFIPSARCYLLPTLTLQRAWRLHGRTWLEQYPEIRAFNNENGRTWTTLSTAVPIDVVFTALSDAMLIRWQQDTVTAVNGHSQLTLPLAL